MQGLHASSAVGVSSNTPPLHDKPSSRYRVVSLMPDWLTGSAPITSDHLLYALDLLSIFDHFADSTLDAPVDLLPPYSFTVRYRPTRQDMLILHCEDYFDVRIQRFGQTLRASFTAYSRALWERGFDCAYILQTLALVVFGVDLVIAPSRLDLCSDVMRFDLRTVDTNRLRDTFLTRALSLGQDESSNQVAVDDDGQARVKTVHGRTLYIGGSKSSAPLAMYEKSAELAVNGKDYYHETWRAGGWDDASPLVRVEYKLKRKSLASVILPDGQPLVSITQLEQCFDSLWQAALLATRMVVPDAAQTNRSRLSTHPLWLSLMAARCSVGSASAVVDPISRAHSRRHNKLQLEKQLVGVMVTYSALSLGAEYAERDDFLSVVSGMFARFEAERGPLGLAVRRRRLDRMQALW